MIEPPWQRLLNRQFQFVLDLLVLVLAFVVSYALRFEFAFQRGQSKNA